MSDLILRKATIDDAELLTELGSRTFAETFEVDNTPENMAAYLTSAFNFAQLSAELSEPNTLFKIAEADGVAVGYSMLRAETPPNEITGERTIELVRLYVSNESLGTGVGAALMKDCIDASRNRGFDTLWLGVWENNFRAQAFYRKWGFVEVGTHIFQLGDDAQRDLLLQRDISD